MFIQSNENKRLDLKICFQYMVKMTEYNSPLAINMIKVMQFCGIEADSVCDSTKLSFN